MAVLSTRCWHQRGVGEGEKGRARTSGAACARLPGTQFLPPSRALGHIPGSTSPETQPSLHPKYEAGERTVKLSITVWSSRCSVSVR